MDNQKWLSRIIVYYVIVLTILRIGLGPFAWYFPQSVFFADVTSSALLDLVNQSRLENNLSAVELNPQLNLAAYKKAQDMLEKQYFAHYSPEGIDPWHWFDQAGYRYHYAGENLAIHFFDSAEVHQAWMNSPSHRDNILGPHYREMGIAVVQGEFEGHPTAIVVQLFGTPYQIAYADTAPEPILPPASEPEALPETELQPEEVVFEEVAQAEEVIVEERETVAPIPNQVEFYPEREWRLLGAASVATIEVPQTFWFKFFKFLSQSYETLLQQLIFYGVILLAIYLAISFIKRPSEQMVQACGWTALMSLLLLVLALLSKDLIWQLISPPTMIG